MSKDHVIKGGGLLYSNVKRKSTQVFLLTKLSAAQYITNHLCHTFMLFSYDFFTFFLPLKKARSGQRVALKIHRRGSLVLSFIQMCWCLSSFDCLSFIQMCSFSVHSNWLSFIQMCSFSVHSNCLSFIQMCSFSVHSNWLSFIQMCSFLVYSVVFRLFRCVHSQFIRLFLVRRSCLYDVTFNDTMC